MAPTRRSCRCGGLRKHRNCGVLLPPDGEPPPGGTGTVLNRNTSVHVPPVDQPRLGSSSHAQHLSAVDVSNRYPTCSVQVLGFPSSRGWSRGVLSLPVIRQASANSA